MDILLNNLSVISAICNGIGWLLYIRGQLLGLTKSNPVGWLMSLLVVISSYVSISLKFNDWSVGLMYAVGIIPALIVFCLCLKNGFKPKLSEYILLSIGIICLLISKIYTDISLIMISLYLFFTYFIFGKSLWNKETEEKTLPWVVWSLAALFQIGAIYMNIGSENFISSSFLSVTNFICWFSIAFLAKKNNISKKGDNYVGS